MRLSFLGGAGTVTGSKYLLDGDGVRVLVDCGLFQGQKELRLKNWSPPPVKPASLDAVILTHAHLDHSGYLPLLIRAGFKGPVFASEATRDLCAILLPDSGYLMEKDAEFANRHGFSKHHPALPLYTEREARAALNSFRSVEFGETRSIGSNARFTLRRAGHILGAATVSLAAQGQTIAFSGDLGRPGSPIMGDPEAIEEADYLIVESTYGDRRHDPTDPEDALADVIIRTVARGGAVLIPSFAVGRAQTLLYHLHRLKSTKRIPEVPIFLDSPMAIDATELLCKHHDDHRLSADACREACNVATYVTDVEDSKRLDRSHMPMIIISASGMATGGRVLHHLKRFAPDPKNTILFAGFQAAGTRGDRMMRGETEVKIHGGMTPINAEVLKLDMLSAHADSDEIMRWLGKFRRPPRHTFVTHGEEEASHALRAEIEARLGWRCSVPALGDEVTLGAGL